ncbi:MAG: TIGR03118 family protein [Actinomycetota bacterium]
MRRRARLVVVALVGAAVAAAGALADIVSHETDTYRVTHLVSDRGLGARVHDARLVNAWGLAASPTGPWWTANEARAASTLYAADGRKQSLTVDVPGGPTGIAYNPGDGFVVRSGKASGASRFIYACEDGMIRAWSPVVPHGWSTSAVIAVDQAERGAVFRGLALATLPDGNERIYATDFHNARVVVFDERWRPVVRRGAFVDRAIPAWYAPFGIQAAGSSVFVSYAWRAPVNGNDAPTGGYVDEFDLEGRLVARVAHMGPLDEPWGMAVAPKGFGPREGSLVVANFGSGRVDVFERRAGGWSFGGVLRRRNGEPVKLPGVWGIAFGNGNMAGPRTTLFFAAGPHTWRGASELGVRGLLGAVSPARR